ncbi:MAG TPA: MATE family efflux transporter [Burkholderiales bacterium]
MSTRAQLLNGPIVPTLVRLAAPGLLLVAFQSLVSIGDTFFVGLLGTEALAGLALVFPLVMLLQMTSAGAMGGGVSSALSRALGAGDARRARRLVVHALVIAIAMGAAFTVFFLLFGRPIYDVLGGDETTLGYSLAYSNVLFGGAVVVWIANTLSSVLRGTGNMLVPAYALVAAAVLHVPLSASLVLGLGPLPRLGIAGAGAAYVVAFGFAATLMAVVVLRKASALRPQADDLRLEWPLFREILRVGALSVVSAVQTVFTAVLLTGFVGRFGAAAIAGYGVGLRLELLQIPLVFAIGQALVVLVGTNLGAGQAARARRIAWVGAGLAAWISLLIGVAVTFFPLAWVSLFSSDPEVLESGAGYLRTVAPLYPFLAVGIALYFASQGAGNVLWPLLAGTARLAIVIAGGLLVASLQGTFAVIALATAVYGALTIWFVARTRWH